MGGGMLWKTSNGQQKMGRTQVFELFSKLKSGATSAEDAEHSTHPSMSKADENVDQVKELVHNNRSKNSHLPSCGNVKE
jgi:hypothetical protein